MLFSFPLSSLTQVLDDVPSRQKQSPVHPSIAVRPELQGVIASSRQQARWFSPPQGVGVMHVCSESTPSAAVAPPHWQSPMQPKIGTLPVSHCLLTSVVFANSNVPTQQARSPSPPQWEGLMQCPLELIANGFASPPQKQSPVQPLTWMRPLSHATPPTSSPPQQPRSPSPPQCVACRQWLFEQLQSPLQPFTSVRPSLHAPEHPWPGQHARWPSPPQGGETATQ